jgi:hypothetical protein
LALVVEQVDPLTVSAAAVEEVAVAAPDAVACIGNEFIGACFHAIEGGVSGELLQPRVGDRDLQGVAEACSWPGRSAKGSP